MKTLTIKDIARELRVSTSTVSRALQDHPDISEETRRAVQAYAKEHNYKPNMMAASLRTAKNTTIGLLIPKVTHYFFASVLRGVEQVAGEAGYSIIIAQSDENPENEKRALHALASARVAGIVACVTKQTTSFDQLQEMIDHEIPVVLFDRLCPLNCDQVISDDFGGAFHAVEYLILTGARRIAYYTASLQIHTAAERFRGYKEALQKYGIAFDPSLVLECDSRAAAIVKSPDFFASAGRPDAILAVNDDTAAGILRSAQMYGIRVPDEMQICGFSNDVLTRHTEPMLTTVQQHGKLMGKKIMEMLLARMTDEGKALPGQTVVMPTDLILRETTH